MNINPRPNNFFCKAMFLQKDIEEFLSAIKECFQDMNDATDAFNKYLIGISYCSKTSD